MHKVSRRQTGRGAAGWYGSSLSSRRTEGCGIMPGILGMQYGEGENDREMKEMQELEAEGPERVVREGPLQRQSLAHHKTNTADARPGVDVGEAGSRNGGWQ